ncbi:hypothetical protein J3A83DRAFT_4258974 [Scleroderma citrinum]
MIKTDSTSATLLMSPDERRGLVPVSCRFVPYDQWLLTHIHNDWKIKQVKYWILARCDLVQAPQPPPQRLSSPIIFSPISELPGYSVDHLVGEDEEYPDDPEHDWLHPDRVSPGQFGAPCDPSTNQPISGGFLADQYTIISFSTGTILEDDYNFSWYKLRPYELLEIHRSGTVISLPREMPLEYVQPYFHARAKALLAVWSHKSGRFKPPGNSTEHEIGHKKRDLPAPPKWRPKLEWKDRWVVIHNDILSLSKDSVGATPRHQFSLATLQVLRGVDSLKRASVNIVADQRVICIKFRTIKARPGIDTPPLTSPSYTSTDSWRTSTSKTSSNAPSSGSARTPEKRKFGRTPRQTYNPDDVCRGEGEWVVLDMLDDHAFANMLRVLHRYAPHPISSSFLPSSSLGDCSATPLQVTPLLHESSCTAIPYPEWRMNTVDTARKAGMGDVGKPMAWVLWPEMSLSNSFSHSIRKHRQELSQEATYPTSPISSCSSLDPESDVDSDSDSSELEWDGWMKDLDRQFLVQEHATGFTKTVHTQSSISSSLSSPLLSDTSSGSQSERIHRLTSLHTTNSSWWNLIQLSSNNGLQKVPSSENLSRSSAEMACYPEIVKAAPVGTISVGSPPSSRRRSTTVSHGIVGKLTRDMDKFSLGQQPTISANDTPQNSRTQYEVPLPKIPSHKILRHAWSSSNLFSRSSHHLSEDSESIVLPPLPSVEPKHQASFMRCVPKRAEKPVRDLTLPSM